MSTQDAERLEAGLAEDERAIQHSGPAKVAWLTVRDDQGCMRYTTVAAGGQGDWDVWVADGRDIPEPGSVRVVYDPAKVRRDIAAKRRILALYEEQADYDLPEGVDEGRDYVERMRDEAVKEALADVVAALAAVYEEAGEPASP